MIPALFATDLLRMQPWMTNVTSGLTDIVAAVIGVVFMVVAYRFMPWLKANTSDDEYSRIIMWANIAVKAAEMIFRESGMGEQKKEWVVNFLYNRGFTIDLEEIEAIVESLVMDLNMEKAKAESTK